MSEYCIHSMHEQYTKTSEIYRSSIFPTQHRYCGFVRRHTTDYQVTR